MRAGGKGAIYLFRASLISIEAIAFDYCPSLFTCSILVDLDSKLSSQHSTSALNSTRNVLTTSKQAVKGFKQTHMSAAYTTYSVLPHSSEPALTKNEASNRGIVTPF
jgi:hypothetical protein